MNVLYAIAIVFVVILGAVHILCYVNKDDSDPEQRELCCFHIMWLLLFAASSYVIFFIRIAEFQAAVP